MGRGKAQNAAEKICKFLEDGPATVQMMASQLALHADCIDFAMHRLRKAGFVEWTGEKTIVRTKQGAKYWRLRRPFDRSIFLSTLSVKKEKPIFELSAMDSVFASWVSK
jgi:Mn-dependent DtxR family transcriptional regulator